MAAKMQPPTPKGRGHSQELIMSILENFDSIAKELITSAQTQKAYDFACKIANLVADKGEDWIKTNEAALHIHYNAEFQKNVAPVAENRAWYIAQWQVALAK